MERRSRRPRRKWHGNRDMKEGQISTVLATDEHEE
jgi:hypothetical protein